MSNDMRSRYWIVTIPWESQPDSRFLDKKHGSCEKLEAKWSKEDKVLYLWYTFKNAQTKLTLKGTVADSLAQYREATLNRYEALFGHLQSDWDCVWTKPIDLVVTDDKQSKDCDQSGHKPPNSRNCDRNSTVDSETDEIYRFIESRLGTGRTSKRRIELLEQRIKSAKKSLTSIIDSLKDIDSD
jgi:hypothetical protein